ncbi:MAG: pyridoxal 5'-phosphate synthase glutaminase subunit PdxT [Lachnospiraceae bacterium]|nr:pyridoxal 5'-phosphate synthase glutaminase subunit PdxT [Lachnospiraceae bacterium]
MNIAVLALQGAFVEHETRLNKLGISCAELRKKEDLACDFDALILPGGESTVQAKLLRDLGLFAPLKERIDEGMPVLATCAGMILLAEHIAGGESPCFASVPMTVRRNAYGRQLGSFHRTAPFADLGDVPMTFIRAPYVEETGTGVEVLARVDGRIVAVRYRKQVALAFHPELDADERIYRWFLNSIV